MDFGQNVKAKIMRQMTKFLMRTDELPIGQKIAVTGERQRELGDGGFKGRQLDPRKNDQKSETQASPEAYYRGLNHCTTMPVPEL